MIAVAGCDRLDDDRVPLMPVNIVFNTVADWDAYSKIGGAMNYNRFIRDQRIPSYFPWLASTYTGFGGVLLLADVYGTVQAYDLSCPVERRQDVRVVIDEDDEFLAVCPLCGSKYNVFSLMGHPVAGEAADKGYAMRRYAVDYGRSGIYCLVRNQ